MFQSYVQILRNFYLLQKVKQRSHINRAIFRLNLYQLFIQLFNTLEKTIFLKKVKLYQVKYLIITSFDNFEIFKTIFNTIILNLKIRTNLIYVSILKVYDYEQNTVLGDIMIL